MMRQSETYAAAKSQACSPEEAARVRLAANPASPPEILYYLAKDPAVTVRAAVANNDEAPLLAAHELARDEDPRVRALIARRLGALAPGLTPHEHERLRRHTYAALERLVTDEAVRVRQTLAETLKEMPGAPRELVLALARDDAPSVSEPIIRLSPILTAEDLIALVTAPPHPATPVWVARRPDITEAVSDAIAATAHVAAIKALLENQSAAIREATLDALITQSAERLEWQEPLVRRPQLSAQSMRRLSEIVTTQLLDVLARRADLHPALGAELKRRVTDRLHPAPAAPAPAEPSRDHRGPVSESMVLDALRRGETRLAAGLLAMAARVPLPVVDRAIALRSAKGLVSLAWKAGFGMGVAGPLQAVLGRIAPECLLRPAPAGSFPLSIEEMRWQLDFLGRPER